jgi:uncharacterized circularly permuted ATP-grasp superfamily protein/uncharacterized alpha-E superfamily protein
MTQMSAFNDTLGMLGSARADVADQWNAVLQSPSLGDQAALAQRFRRAQRLLRSDGAALLIREVEGGAASQPWALDAVPYVVTRDEFATVASGVEQRARALIRLARSLSGTVASDATPSVAARLLADYPEVFANRLRRSLGVATPAAAVAPPITHLSVDVVRDVDGVWRIVGHDVAAPVGLGYSQLYRSVSARLDGELLRRHRVARHEPLLTALRDALAAHAGDRSARTVVLTGGPLHPAFIEHSLLARQLGFHLVEGGDVVMRARQFWLRAVEGHERIDVVLRYLDDDELDPLETDRAGRWPGVPGVAWGAMLGGVALANPFGIGVLDHPGVHDALGRSAAEGLDAGAALAVHDGQTLEAVPVFGGQLASASVVLRVHAVVSTDGVTVMRGASGRVLADGDHPRHPTARLAKDVWVVDSEPPQQRRRPQSAARVDLGTSLPRRAADAMWLLGRAIERAECGARIARLLHTEALLGADPLADPLVADVAAMAQRMLLDLPNEPIAAAVCAHEVARRLRDAVIEAQAVREYLPAGFGAAISRLSEAVEVLVVSAADGTPIVDTLDDALVVLAAAAGQLAESTVRGPAWRFAELGRRVQRAVEVLNSVEVTLADARSASHLQAASDVVLAAHECLVAFRRRYRTDAELGSVLDLLLHDDTNPRSVAFQIDRCREAAAALSWGDGVNVLDRAARQLTAADDDGSVHTIAIGRRPALDRLVLAVRGEMLALADEVGRRWLSDPVRPIQVRS